MALKTEELNKLAKEKQDIIRALDKDPSDDDLKKKLKNLNEKIRYNTKKLEKSAPKIKASPKVVKEKTKRKAKVEGAPTAKSLIIAEFKKGNTDVEKIAAKYDININTVKRYQCYK